MSSPNSPAASGIAATTAMRVAADLRRRILAGEFQPGARLKIDDLAALTGVSHMPVRDALHALATEGVLEVIPHRGALIRAVDAAFVRNIYDLRAAIEGMLTERCAERIDAEGIARLQRAAADYEAAAKSRSAATLLERNRALHETINAVADNDEALRVLGQGRLLIEALRLRLGFGTGRVEAIVAEHRALVKAIAGRDPARAGEIARRHCTRARNDLLARISLVQQGD